jgi:ABC-2 type transport system ATP-binding protein
MVIAKSAGKDIRFFLQKPDVWISHSVAAPAMDELAMTDVAATVPDPGPQVDTGRVRGVYCVELTIGSGRCGSDLEALCRWSEEEITVADYAIETNGLSVYYGRQRGILDVDLRVDKGEVFGFLGPNGAGKTTTQRVLMDIIRPTAGEARIFGRDCQKESVAARDRVGYLPGELSLYDSMRVREFFEMYFSLQQSNTDPKHWRTLSARLDLDTSRRIGQLSRGNRQKVGVVAAFMNKPDLLILDEPTTGLDPLVQQTVMELVREANKAGATVFFSSHILPEVQAVCDRVGIIREGRLVATERVEDLTRQHFKRIRFTFATVPPDGAFSQDGVKVLARDGQGVTLEIYKDLDRVMERAAALGITDIETIPVSLEEIFLAYYGRGNGGNNA